MFIDHTIKDTGLAQNIDWINNPTLKRNYIVRITFNTTTGWANDLGHSTYTEGDFVDYFPCVAAGDVPNP